MANFKIPNMNRILKMAQRLYNASNFADEIDRHLDFFEVIVLSDWRTKSNRILAELCIPVINNKQIMVFQLNKIFEWNMSPAEM